MVKTKLKMCALGVIIALITLGISSNMVFGTHINGLPEFEHWGFLKYHGVELSKEGLPYHHVDVTTTCDTLRIETEGNTLVNQRMPITSDTLHLRIYDIPNGDGIIVILTTCGTGEVLKTPT